MPSMSRPRAATSVATQHRARPGPETFDGSHPLLLRAIGMQRGRCGFPCRIRRDASRSAPIFVRQNTSYRAGRFITQPAREPLRLLARGNGLDRVRNRLRRSAAAPDLHILGSCRNSFVSFSTSAGIGRREEQSVCRTGGQRRQDPLHVGPEAHVEHAIGFVEHQHFQSGKAHRIVPHVIHQPARRRDDDVDVRFQRLRSCRVIGTPPKTAMLEILV